MASPSSPRDHDTPGDAREPATPSTFPIGGFGAARKRTRRACDKCSRFRVRCDGRHPCNDSGRCQEYGHNCNYARTFKKRGRKPRSHNAVNAAASPYDHLHHHPGAHLDLLLPERVQLRQQKTFVELSPSPAVQNGAGFRREDDEHHDGGPGEKSEGYEDGDHTDVSNAVYHQHASSSHNHNHDHNHQSVRRVSQIINSPLQTPALANNSQQVAVTGLPAPGGTGAQQARPVHEPLQYPGCRYKCLEPVMPLLESIISPKIACDLLDFYFTEPNSSLFRHASPYVLSPVIRRQSLLHPTKPRETTPALLVTMLWTTAQTCDLPPLLLPGRRGQVCEKLRILAMSLVHERDRDHWHRALGGRLLKDELYHDPSHATPLGEETLYATANDQPPCQTADDILTLILFTIVISGGDFKTDSFVWWHKAVRLAQALGLNRLDSGTSLEQLDTDGCVNAQCRLRHKIVGEAATTLAALEAQEELRRAFWLLFVLDRHFALSFNGSLFIHDDEIHAYEPLPDEMWEHLETVPFETLTRRSYGPPTLVSGTGFFQYFLPLMTLLGDVIETHRRSLHPRLGTLDDTAAVTMIEGLLDSCAQSIDELSSLHDIDKYSNGSMPINHFGDPVLTPSTNYSNQDPYATSPTAQYHNLGPRRNASSSSSGQVLLVTAYARFIVNVLHVLLHGKWDAVSMLSPATVDDDAGHNPGTSPTQPQHPSLGISNWITSVEFMKCASHAILASEAVETVLSADPELTFMPYLLGIYLLHGSFILLLFADRMPQVGPNASVEKACETMIRAHEVCVVTLNTEFQKGFRKVLRGTLYEVRKNIGGEEIRGDGPIGQGRHGQGETEDGRARRSALSLYRWTRGSRGLAV